MKKNVVSFFLLVVLSTPFLHAQSDTAKINLQYKDRVPFLLNVKTISGKIFPTLPDGKNIYVLNFWFIACGPCRKEIPALNRLALKYKKNTFIKFVAISNMDDANSLGFVTKRLGLVYEQVPSGKLFADQFGVEFFPTNLIISRDGTIEYIRIGYSEGITDEMSSILGALN